MFESREVNVAKDVEVVIESVESGWLNYDFCISLTLVVDRVAWGHSVVGGDYRSHG